MTTSREHSTEPSVPAPPHHRPLVVTPGGGKGTVRRDGLGDLFAQMLALAAPTAVHGDGCCAGRRRRRDEDER
jgi:hypothetical protein